MLRTRSLGDSLEAGSAAATEQSSPDRRLTASMEICISDRPSGSAAEPPSIVVPIVDHVPGLPEGVSPFEMVQNVAVSSLLPFIHPLLHVPVHALPPYALTSISSLVCHAA